MIKLLLVSKNCVSAGISARKRESFLEIIVDNFIGVSLCTPINQKDPL